MLERVAAVRYAVPLREGGSLPGVVEASDDGTYVAKLRGAGQGLKVLVAEVIVGEIGRLLGVAVPRMVVLDLPRAIARYEADEEVQDLLTASIGDNLGVDYLPGSFGYDGSRPAAAEVAAPILWLDAFTANVDRTWANPNLLLWHREVWAIDHGAALYVHHAWARRAPDAARFAALPFDASEHVLAELVPAGQLAAQQERAAATLTEPALRAVVDLVPQEWLETSEALPTADGVREAYVEHLRARLAAPQHWLPGGSS